MIDWCQMTTLGDWLLVELERRGWTQGELARRSHIAKSHISRMISGQRSAGIETLRGLANALDVPLDELSRLSEGSPIPGPGSGRARTRDRRVVYVIDGEHKLQELWAGLSPEDQRRMLDLMERLQSPLEPRIIGEE